MGSGLHSYLFFAKGRRFDIRIGSFNSDANVSGTSIS